jgi:hypothetical protein
LVQWRWIWGNPPWGGGAVQGGRWGGRLYRAAPRV